jgi:hypothetical protein
MANLCHTPMILPKNENRNHMATPFPKYVIEISASKKIPTFLIPHSSQPSRSSKPLHNLANLPEHCCSIVDSQRRPSFSNSGHARGRDSDSLDRIPISMAAAKKFGGIL